MHITVRDGSDKERHFSFILLVIAIMEYDWCRQCKKVVFPHLFSKPANIPHSHQLGSVGSCWLWASQTGIHREAAWPWANQTPLVWPGLASLHAQVQC